MNMDVFELRRRVGEEDVARLVERFYERVRDDPELGPVFDARIAADAWPRHLSRMRDFWSTVLLGSGRYRGDPMAVHAAIPGVGRAHFAAWLALFGQVAREVCAGDVATAILQRAERMEARLIAALGV